MGVWNGTLPSLLAGDEPSAAEWAEILGALNAAYGPWTSYTPGTSPALAWTSTSGTPAIVSGTLEARYQRIGKLLKVTGRMVAAADTTFGGAGGLWSMSLPFSAFNGNLYAGRGFVIDASTGTNNKPIAVRMDGVNAVRFYSDGGQLGQAVPFTWASGDQLHWFAEAELA